MNELVHLHICASSRIAVPAAAGGAAPTGEPRTRRTRRGRLRSSSSQSATAEPISSAGARAIAADGTDTSEPN